MRRFLWFLCLLPMWAACSCDGDGNTGDAKGIVSAAENPLDFNGVFVGDRLSKTLTLKNEGRARVQVWVESAPAGYDLLPTKENPLNIGPAASAEVNVIFSPDKVGRFDGDLVLGTSGTKAPAEPIKLLGEGLNRELVVPQELVFGVVPVHASKTLPLEIKSLAGADLKIKLQLGEDEKNFHIEETELTVGVDSAATIDVKFLPLSEGGIAGRLSITTCEGCEAYIVRLRGEGGRSDLRAEPPMLTFGTISPGKKQEIDLRLINAGNMPVEVTKAVFLEGTDEGFVRETNLDLVPGLVEVDRANVVKVAFAPAADLVELGEKEGSIAFYGLDDQLLFDVPMRATAGGPDVSVSPKQIDFGVVPLRVQSRRLVTITNVGNRAPATVEEIFIRGSASRFTFRSPNDQVRFDLADEPVVIEVFFEAPADKELVGDYADTLVIRTDDDDSREIQVALTGHAADIPPCDLRINPGQVRFGLVPVGVALERDVEVFNQGISECALWDFHLENGGGNAFRLVEPPEGTLLIGSQETVVLQLSFDPPDSVVNQLLSSAIIFSHSTPDDPPKRIEVSGYPSSHQIEVIPNPIDFGGVPIGYDPIKAVSVINTGATATQVDRVVVSPDNTNFRATPGSASAGSATIPGTIGSGQRAPVRVAFMSTAEGVETAEFQVWLTGVDEPLRIPIRAEGRDEPCGDLCEAPKAICPPDERVLVNQRHPLPGEAFNAAGDEMSCTWRIVNKPFGSREQPTPENSCDTEFQPDMVGDYILEMAVVDEQGKFNSCQTRLTAIPHGGLWVEMFWEKASDVDLHFLHPNRDPLVSSNWWSDDDCYYGGRNRAWDGGGDASASLDRDDTQNTGPENVRINRPVIGHRYAVGVHWFRNAGHATTWVTTNIYCGGVIVGSDTFDMNTNKEFVLVGDVQNNGIAGCTWRPDGTRWIRP